MAYSQATVSPSHSNDFTAVFGIYPDRPSVENAVTQLKLDGFTGEDISVLLPEVSGISSHDFAHELHTKAPEGAVTGAGSGAMLGGALGWLAGVGALAIPGVGPLIAAGPIMGALAGAGMGGAVGGVTGALIGLGIPEYEAKRYDCLVKDGGMLLSVHSIHAERIQNAQDLLKATGARDISSAVESKSV